MKESTSGSWGGKVSLLPKRAPLSAEEMEAILVCVFHHLPFVAFGVMYLSCIAQFRYN